MIIYLVKSTLLLTILLVLYKLLLENEKMHQFNRFFLLFALVFGLTAPLISFDLSPEGTIAGIELQQVERLVSAPAEIISKSIAPETTPILSPTPLKTVSEAPSYSISKESILWSIYGMITFLLLLRFGNGLFRIVSTIKSGETSSLNNATLVLVEEELTPQSFLNFIFLNKKDYESGNIGSEILEHEQTHVDQFHSLDVVFIELLKIVFWFNPILYVYKKAIQLNHEFISDEIVLKKGSSVSTYQQILIEACTPHQEQTSITSKFNPSKIKRRVYMVSKYTSHPTKLFKKLLVFPILVLLFAAFSTGVDSQTIASLEKVNSKPDSSRVYVQIHSNGLSAERPKNLPDSPFVSDFLDRLKTYQSVFESYESGQKSKRDVLYQRTRLIWLHQRITPEEQQLKTVPRLPSNFLDDIPLTERETLFQKHLSEYLTLRESYKEIPLDESDTLYATYKELKERYELLSLSSQLFLVGNLPPDPYFFYMERNLEVKFDKDFPNPFQMSFSREDPSMTVNFIDKNGNVVSKILSDLTELEKEYLKRNAKKAMVTQVYPLPFEENPSQEDFKKWEDDYLYKVTLDKKKIDNDQLETLDPKTIHHVEIFEVPRNGNQRVPYDYEIMLFSYAGFEEMVKKYNPSQNSMPFYNSILID